MLIVILPTATVVAVVFLTSAVAIEEEFNVTVDWIIRRIAFMSCTYRLPVLERIKPNDEASRPVEVSKHGFLRSRSTIDIKFF